MKRFLKDLVPFHDFTTQTTVLIPKRELAPGVILVQIQGNDTPVYAAAAQLRQGPYQHPAFEGASRAALESLAVDLEDVFPQSVEQWEDGFRRDRNPGREMAGWLHLAAILKVMTNNYNFSPAEKKECFSLLVACSNGTRDTVRHMADCRLLSEERIAQAVKYFYDGGY